MVAEQLQGPAPHNQIPKPKAEVYEKNIKPLQKAKRNYLKKSCAQCGQRIGKVKARKQTICEGCTAVHYC